MTRIMYDSVNAKAIPSQAVMVAGYIDGRYANIAEMRARFPHSTLVEIAVRATTDAGQVLDVERGDATPSQAVSWVQVRRRAGADPTVYTSLSEWNAVRSAFRNNHVPEPHYWIADWDGDASLLAGTVAKQYHNTPNWDVSVVADYWPGVDHPSMKPPQPSERSHYIVKSGDTLSKIATDYHMSLNSLEKLNPQIHHPDLIHPGDLVYISGDVTLRISGKYLVKTGDTLSGIALAHHTTVKHLMSVNKQITDPDHIYAGSYINL